MIPLGSQKKAQKLHKNTQDKVKHAAGGVGLKLSKEELLPPTHKKNFEDELYAFLINYNIQWRKKL